MRLHHLSVAAFGPFVETAQVDFDALSDAGLFLLSGATGAGKSSVLDAVCFALYGAVPGDRNHAGRLRSDQAPAGLVPQVTLEATLGSRRFRLVRSPAYDRPKKRGTGTTREQAKVTLSERVGEQWVALTSRLDEAGDLVCGLLGMNLDQFCQVALLPQGQFQAFLRADSQARQALLTRLFRTARFERVEGWLRDHRLELRRTSEGHREVVADLVSRLSEAAGLRLPDGLDPVTGSAGDGSLAAWVRSVRDDATARATAAVDTSSELAEAEAGARDALEATRERSVARARVVDAAATVSRLEAEGERHDADVLRLERSRRADALQPLFRLMDDRAAALALAREKSEAALAAVIPLAEGAPPSLSALTQELDALAAELASVVVLLPAERRLLEVEAERDLRADELRAMADEEALAVAEAAALRARLEQLTTAVAEADAAVVAVPGSTARVADLRGVVSASDGVVRLEAELVLAKVDHGAAAARVLDLRSALLDLRERRIAGMAAELAGALAAGDDCPVCGSSEHPHPAAALDGHPDAAVEREAQRAVDDALADETARSMRVHELEMSLSACREVVGDRDPAVSRAELAAAESEHAALRAKTDRRPELAARLEEARARDEALTTSSRTRERAMAELEAALEHLRAESTALAASLAEARGADGALSDVVERLEGHRAALRLAHDRVTALEAADSALRDAEVAVGRATLEAGFEGVDDARASALPEHEQGELERRVRDHGAALVAARRVLAEPETARLLAEPATDLEALTGAHRAAAAALESSRAAADLAARLRNRVAALHDDLEAALAAWQPVRDELTLATAVSSFAEGKAADNRLQMRLSAYVLAHRLSQVVAAANARLAGMSDQRFSLEHVARRGAGETRGGLSLAVRDDWSGESRDPATLSGGETFVVSLALALGLADVVAHEAGGVELATLFVDEGFGSLDAETLDDVLDILDTLREGGRAVGVVSHVAEMRHRIPAQLVVAKARTGSTVSISGVAG